MITILITTSTFDLKSAENLSGLESAGIKIIMNPYSRKLTEGEIATLIEQYQPIGMIAGIEPLSRHVLSAGCQLKIISRCGIGMDSVDLQAAHDFGIKVTNTPDAPTIPVAELTLAMMLSLLRHVHISDSSIRHGHWERPMGSLLYGKIVGIIGCGRIGSYVAKLLSGFECHVLGYDIISQNSDHFENTDLPELLRRSDIVTLHLTHSRETHHFLNEKRIGMMKKGALLINAARGGLVDEAALLAALKSGQLGKAALDCFEEEPYHGPLKDLDNVLLTAHIGSYAKEARAIMEKQAADNLITELQRIGVIK